MSDFTINITPPPQVSVEAGDLRETSIVAGGGVSPHSPTHESGGNDPIRHDYLSGISGGNWHLTSQEYNNLVYLTGNQSISGVKDFYLRPTVNGTGILLSGESTTGYLTGYVLKSETGSFITTSQTGSFYPHSNPSGYITGIDLSSYATQSYVTGISGGLNAQINLLSGQSVLVTGDQTIAGSKTFSDNLIGNGTSNRLPNQSIETSDSVLTRSHALGYFAELAINQSLSGTTTMTDMSGVSISLPVGIYQVTSCLTTSPANSAMGQKIGIISSGGASGTVYGYNDFSSSSIMNNRVPYFGATIANFAAGETRQVAGGSHGQAAQSVHNFILKVTAGTSTWKCQFAQHTSNGSLLTARAGSWIRAVRIS